MKVKVILKENIKGVGKKDEIIEVKDGYANNFLFAQNKAVPATDENLKKLKNKAEKNVKDHAKEVKKAEEIKEKINNKEITLAVKAGENGKVFGSIGSKEIVDEVKKVFGLTIDKKKIDGENSRMKELGLHDVEVKLHSEVKAILKVKLINKE
ncbi:50S ribosomal protein L9 [Sebaldella sp. S0638]|uniref:50S ribosomal protein L9 n=1 Tax=Sebaldella sp. S0638 TaxID=2957809 RepID=UPI00209C920D|nr:50S ribosomal protein L9 [Sebaldella sp. S0638]MCP1222875.1 50S ribosomal protein L9 [Sebaldella sp. S0638]